MTATRAAGFAGEIALSVTGLPPKVTAALKNIPGNAGEVKVPLTPAQRSTAWYFFVVAALFFVQTLLGGATAHSAKRGATTEAPGGQPPRDPTLRDPRCVLQILRRHFARYTPALVAEACGCTPEQVVQVADLLCANSGRERTSAVVYAVG